MIDRTPLVVGPIPAGGDVRRFQFLALLAPLAAGLVLFAFSPKLQFLVLALVSPLVLVATVVDDRRHGRRSHRAELAAFRAVLASALPRRRGDARRRASRSHARQS